MVFGSMNEAGAADASTGSFNTKYSRLNLQGVANIGRIMNFESFTRSFGLLLHGGAGIGRVNPERNHFQYFRR